MTTTAETFHAELRPLGIDVESSPFVAIAALASLAPGLAAWLRASLTPVLGLVVLAMLAPAGLDVSEVVHQADIGETGSAVLASGVAALHLAARVVAAAMATRALRLHAGPRPALGATLA